MLNEKETAALIALINAFVLATGISARGLSMVLGVSNSTAARWLDPSRATEHRVYRYVARRVEDVINRLNERNELTGLYDNIASMPPAHRATTLVRVHRGEVVC